MTEQTQVLLWQVYDKIVKVSTNLCALGNVVDDETIHILIFAQLSSKFVSEVWKKPERRIYLKYRRKMAASSSRLCRSCWKVGSEWSNRWPKSMFMITLDTHALISCFTSKSRPWCSRNLLIISSTSIRILVSITRWPKPNRFKIDRHSWWLLRNLES